MTDLIRSKRDILYELGTTQQKLQESVATTVDDEKRYVHGCVVVGDVATLTTPVFRSIDSRTCGWSLSRVRMPRWKTG